MPILMSMTHGDSMPAVKSWTTIRTGGPFSGASSRMDTSSGVSSTFVPYRIGT